MKFMTIRGGVGRFNLVPPESDTFQIDSSLHFANIYDRCVFTFEMGPHLSGEHKCSCSLQCVTSRTWPPFLLRCCSLVLLFSDESSPRTQLKNSRATPAIWVIFIGVPASEAHFVRCSLSRTELLLSSTMPTKHTAAIITFNTTPIKLLLVPGPKFDSYETHEHPHF